MENNIYENRRRNMQLQKNTKNKKKSTVCMYIYI